MSWVRAETKSDSIQRVGLLVRITVVPLTLAGLPTMMSEPLEISGMAISSCREDIYLHGVEPNFPILNHSMRHPFRFV